MFEEFLVFLRDPLLGNQQSCENFGKHDWGYFPTTL